MFLLWKFTGLRTWIPNTKSLWIDLDYLECSKQFINFISRTETVNNSKASVKVGQKWCMLKLSITFSTGISAPINSRKWQSYWTCLRAAKKANLHHTKFIICKNLKTHIKRRVWYCQFAGWHSFHHMIYRRGVILQTGDC